MYKRLITILLIVAIGTGSALIVGCESDAKTGALLGGAAGAAIGNLAGGDTEATLIGGGIGAAAGYFIGNEQDKKKEN